MIILTVLVCITILLLLVVLWRQTEIQHQLSVVFTILDRREGPCEPTVPDLLVAELRGRGWQSVGPVAGVNGVESPNPRGADPDYDF